MLLALIPLFVLFLSGVAREEKGFVRIALVSEGETGSLSHETTQELVLSGGLIGFEIYDEKDKALSSLTRGIVDAVWVFPEDMEKRVEKFLSGDGDSFIVEITEREESVITSVVREKLTGTLFRRVCRDVYLDYIRENVPELDEYSDEELIAQYESFEEQEGIFEYTEVNSIEEKGYVIAPIRGILSLLIVLGALAGAIQYNIDEKNGLFLNFSRFQKVFAEFFSVFIWVFALCVSLLVSLALSGLWLGFVKEVVSALVFAVSSTLFAIFVSNVFGSNKVIAAISPLLISVQAAVCPVFFDFRMARKIRLLFPPTYYLGNITSALVYIAALVILITLVKKIRKGYIA